MKRRWSGALALCGLLVSLAAAAGVGQKEAEAAARAAQPGKVVSAVQATSGGKPVWVIAIEHDDAFSEVLIDAASGAVVKGAIDPPPAAAPTPAPDC